MSERIKYSNPVTCEAYTFDMMVEDMKELRAKRLARTITEEEEDWLHWAEEKMEKWSS